MKLNEDEGIKFIFFIGFLIGMALGVGLVTSFSDKYNELETLKKEKLKLEIELLKQKNQS